MQNKVYLMVKAEVVSKEGRVGGGGGGWCYRGMGKGLC
jgi:hypothetical protein